MSQSASSRLRVAVQPAFWQAALLANALLLGGGAGQDTASATIPAFHKVFGVPDGEHARPVHTKGLVVEGVFFPSPSAATITKAAFLLGGAPVPVTVRLSTFAGMPASPDAGPFAAPRGMAIKFHLGGDDDADLVTHSYNGFPAATPAEFLAFLGALAQGNGEASPGEGAFDTFLATHQAARTFIQTPQPPPASWANESFFGVNAFVFIDAAGNRRYGRLRIVPSAGEQRLNGVASPNYLSDALLADLSRGPVRWHILVQMAAPGDVVDDGSVPWPAGRPLVELGLLQIERPVADTTAAERALLFNPLNLVPGIEPSSDPMLAARSRAYGESYRIRSR